MIMRIKQAVIREKIMIRLTSAIAVLVFAGTTLPAMAELSTYKIDSAHSSANFSVRHMMISNVKGEFSKVTGSIDYDPKKPSASKIDATIDMDTVDTREPARDKHLKSPDFFDTAKYPTMEFKSKKVVAKGKQLDVTGDLTLHGVTKEVVLHVDGPSAEINDGHGGLRRGASATTKINRQDFGVQYNKNLDGGGLAVGNEVDISIDVEFSKPKVAAAPAQ